MLNRVIVGNLVSEAIWRVSDLHINSIIPTKIPILPDSSDFRRVEKKGGGYEHVKPLPHYYWTQNLIMLMALKLFKFKGGGS